MWRFIQTLFRQTLDIMTTKWIEWWQSLSATDRFPLMRKYDVNQVTDKLIKKMWLGEVENAT